MWHLRRAWFEPPRLGQQERYTSTQAIEFGSRLETSNAEQKTFWNNGSEQLTWQGIRDLSTQSVHQIPHHPARERWRGHLPFQSFEVSVLVPLLLQHKILFRWRSAVIYLQIIQKNQSSPNMKNQKHRPLNQYLPTMKQKPRTMNQQLHPMNHKPRSTNKRLQITILKQTAQTLKKSRRWCLNYEPLQVHDHQSSVLMVLYVQRKQTV